ncbi:MAG: hypothetical protein GC190_19955 [Alphaproteobacteria bacterium]|nr:hypothetical protein [Alphaproteobacteria bacterium]
MAKFKPGIPDSFTLNVEPVRDLGDYLDEPSPTPQRRPKPQEQEVRGEEAPATPQPSMVEATPTPTVQPEPVVTKPAFIAPSTPVERIIERPVPQTVVDEPTRPTQPINEDVAPKPKAPRREISMTPETLRMSDELLDLIRSGSGQRDTKANELFHALVLLVHEAMDEIDPHGIPKRGRWGTPTARAYPLELKNAFLRALLRKYGGGNAPYSVNDAA